MEASIKKSLNQDLLANLARAAVGLLSDEAAVNDFLAYFGRCFVRTLQHCGHGKSIQVFKLNIQIQIDYFTIQMKARGRYFSEFLTGINNIHLNFRYTFPKMKSMSVFVVHEDADGAVINYRTTRLGLCPFLYGSCPTIR